MTSIFGIPMSTLMAVMLAAVLLATTVLGILALRNPLLLKLGLRNVPRRRAQSILIVVGLMLSSIIVTSALVAGDSFSYSIRVEGTASIGAVDELLTNGHDSNDTTPAAPGRPIPQATVARVRAALPHGAADGVTGVVILRGAIQDMRSRQTSASVNVTGVAPHYPPAFGALRTTAQSTAPLGALGGTGVYLNHTLADKLNAHGGDRLRLSVAGRIHTMRVAGILTDSGLAGGGLLELGAPVSPVALLPLPTLQAWSGYQHSVSQILISNPGGTLNGVGGTARVDAALRHAGIGVPIHNVKRELLNAANKAGSEFTAGFLAFGLFSIVSGVMLIFLIFVMLAAERRTEMGIARAIGTQRRHLVQQFLFEGYVYDLGAAGIGTALGIFIGLMLTGALSSLAQNAGVFTIYGDIEPRSIIVAFCLGALVTLITVVSACWRVSSLNVVAAIRDMPDDLVIDGSVRAAFAQPLTDLARAWRLARSGHVAATLRTGLAAAWHAITAPRVFVGRGPVPIVLGLLIARLGWETRQLFPFDLGVSLVLIGVPMTLRWVAGVAGVSDRLRNRAGYSLAGLALVVYWLLPFDLFRKNWDFGIEMFVLAGIMLTLGGVWTAMYNIDVLLGGFVALTGGIGRITPAVKTAVKYPLQHRFRTGITLFMFSLIVFALNVQAVLATSFAAEPLNLNRDLGGFAIYGTASAGVPVQSIERAAMHASALHGRLSGAGSIGLERFLNVHIHVGGRTKEGLPTGVADAAYLRNATWTLHSRTSLLAPGPHALRSLITHPGYIVVDNDMMSAFDPSWPSEISKAPAHFTPLHITALQGRAQRPLHLTVVGVLAGTPGYIGSYPPAFTGAVTFRAAHLPVPAPTTLYFRMKPGVSVHHTALALGSTFLRDGLDLTEAQAEYNKGMALSIGLNNLLEAFMALGLVVGVAALGVVATRSVVERRQQIGMVRAIGFSRGLVQLTFLLESSIITVLGTAIGSVLGLLLGRQIVTFFAKSDPTLTLSVPWAEIGLIMLGVYLASLLTTFLPAWQASRVHPAEARRYE
jgi:putative ABC transport system permease protein